MARYIKKLTGKPDLLESTGDQSSDSLSKRPKWTLGILNDTETDEVPGSVLLLSSVSQRQEPLGLQHAQHRTSTSSLPSPFPPNLSRRSSQLSNYVPKKRTADGTIVLEPQPDDSLNDPLNWPLWRRNAALLSLGLFCMVGGGMTTVLAAGFNNVAATFDISLAQVSLTTGLYMMGLGLGSVVMSPTAILFGKRPVYLANAIAFVLSAIWCALSPSFASLIVARIFQGFAVSPVECLPSATVAEIFFLHERAYRLGIYTLLLLGGKNLVPLVSAVVVQNLGWRWVFGVVAFVVAFLGALLFFFVPETFWDRTPRPKAVTKGMSNFASRLHLPSLLSSRRQSKATTITSDILSPRSVGGARELQPSPLPLSPGTPSSPLSPGARQRRSQNIRFAFEEPEKAGTVDGDRNDDKLENEDPQDLSTEKEEVVESDDNVEKQEEVVGEVSEGPNEETARPVEELNVIEEDKAMEEVGDEKRQTPTIPHDTSIMSNSEGAKNFNDKPPQPQQIQAPPLRSMLDVGSPVDPTPRKRTKKPPQKSQNLPSSEKTKNPPSTVPSRDAEIADPNKPESYTDRYRGAPPKTYVQTLKPYSGRFSHESWFRAALRPFILFLYPSILWSAAVYALSVGWLIVISESIAAIFRNRDTYNFSSLQTGLVYLSPFIGGILGTAAAGRVSDIIVRFMSRKNGGVYEPEFRLVMGIPIAITTTMGLMGFGWSAQERDLWVVPTIFFGIISFGCTLGSTTAITFCVDSYRQYAGEALVTLNFSKNIFHGLVFSLFFTEWLEKDGGKQVFNTIGGIQLIVLSLTIPMYIYGKRARMWTVRRNLMELI